nr:unnamed protein product [Callosobruchus analis]
MNLINFHCIQNAPYI